MLQSIGCLKSLLAPAHDRHHCGVMTDNFVNEQNAVRHAPSEVRDRSGRRLVGSPQTER